MDLLNLRYFTTLVESGSFSRAAARLGIAQPSLSRQIQKLELELESPLFYRHGRGTSLTDAGRKLYEAMIPALRQFDDIRQEIIEQSKAVSGLVRFGVPPSIGSTVIAPLVRNFSARCPAVQLHVLEAFSGTLFEWVEAGAVDVCILYDARRAQSMSVTPALHEELFLIERFDIVKAGVPVEIDELRLDDLVLPGSGHGLRRVVDAAFLKLGIRLNPMLEIDSVSALKQLVENGGAQTILPLGAVHREIRDGRLSARRIGFADVFATLVIAMTLHKPLSTAARILVELVQDEIARCIDNGILSGTSPRKGETGKSKA
jgi:LysR family transcriptional regulator, nitrogen assimilation regulatory protein